MASASWPAVKVREAILQLVLTFTCSLYTSISCKVPLMTSSIQIMGRDVSYLTKQVQDPFCRAPQKISIAQSVVPPPGISFQLMIPGYLRLRTSNPYLLKQYCPSSSPAYLVIPYMVEGSIIVCCGVDSLGVLGPKTAIELAQKTFLTFIQRDKSKIVFRDCKFTDQATSGFYSPVTDSTAAKWQTCVKLCFWKMRRRAATSVTSAFSRAPSQVAGMCLCPKATTLPFP